jgi:hypothetical protein
MPPRLQAKSNLTEFTAALTRAPFFVLKHFLYRAGQAVDTFLDILDTGTAKAQAHLMVGFGPC